MKIRTFLLMIFVLLFSFQLQAERFVPKSDLIPYVLQIIDRAYVDDKRIIPNEMLEGSLDRLSTSIAQVLTNVEEIGNDRLSIEISVDLYSKKFEYKKPKTVTELNNILQDIARFSKEHLEKEEKPENVDYALINGFLKKLDPHSFLLIPEVYSDFSTNTTGNFGGVGMMIGLREGKLTVIAPIDDTPASRAGLRAKDHIVQINDESTINMSTTEAVKRLRGEAGTTVEIHIMRKGLTSPKKYMITRAMIEIHSVESHVFKKDQKRVGYLKVKTFQKNTLDEINKELEGMDYDLRDFMGLILDLRNNPGGLLDQAIRVSDRFIDHGEIVSTAGLDVNISRNVKSYDAHWFRTIADIPIIVLVNNGSASASEIVAAALKKNKRAVVIGMQTFGKGSVQQVIPLPGGAALKLTTSKYLTPGKISIQSVGVSPHIEVVPRYISPDLLRVIPSKEDQTERSLDNNFSEWGDRVEEADKTTFYLFEEDEELEKVDPDDLDVLKKLRLEKDFLIQSAQKILFKNNKSEFKDLMQNSMDFVEKEEKVQEKKIIGKFATLSTDWNEYGSEEAGKLTSEVWLEVKTTVDGKETWKKLDSTIEANSEIRLYVKAKNIGKTVISRLLATTESKNPIFNDQQFAFGKLAAGEAKQWYFPIKISESSLSRNDLIHFRFTDQEKREIHQDKTALKILAKQRPGFLYNITFFENGKHDSKGNGDKKLQVAETVAVKIDITNKGEGKSGPVTIILKNGEGKNIFLKRGRKTIDPLDVGKSEIVYFQFDLKSLPDDQDLDFSFDLIDAVYSLTSVNQKIKIPLEITVEMISNNAPAISLKNVPLVSTKRSYHFTGDIFDDKGVKDMYIFNKKKKVYYKNFLTEKNRKKVNFSVDLELENEENRIIVVSRDDYNVTSQRTLYVRYSGIDKNKIK